MYMREQKVSLKKRSSVRAHFPPRFRPPKVRNAHVFSTSAGRERLSFRSLSPCCPTAVSYPFVRVTPAVCWPRRPEKTGTARRRPRGCSAGCAIYTTRWESIVSGRGHRFWYKWLQCPCRDSRAVFQQDIDPLHTSRRMQGTHESILSRVYTTPLYVPTCSISFSVYQACAEFDWAGLAHHAYVFIFTTASTRYVSRVRGSTTIDTYFEVM